MSAAIFSSLDQIGPWSSRLFEEDLRRVFFELAPNGVNYGLAGSFGLNELEEEIALFELRGARFAAAVFDWHTVLKIERQRRGSRLRREDQLGQGVRVFALGVGDVTAALGFAELDLRPARIRAGLSGVHTRGDALIGRDPRERKRLSICRDGDGNCHKCDKK